MVSNRLKIALVLLAGLILGGLGALALLPQARARLFIAGPMKTVGQALIGGPFTLTDHTGKRVTDQDFRGRAMLVYFGFTFCPDVCPSGLQVIAAALDKLGPKANAVAPLFITVDPERDTPAQLAQYVSSFHPRLIGLTGSREEIEAVTKAYRVYVKKVEDPKSTAGYTIDHSAILYIMGPDGAFQAHFTHAVSADALAQRLDKLLQ